MTTWKEVLLGNSIQLDQQNGGKIKMTQGKMSKNKKRAQGKQLSKTSSIRNKVKNNNSFNLKLRELENRSRNNVY